MTKFSHTIATALGALTLTVIGLVFAAPSARAQAPGAAVTPAPVLTPPPVKPATPAPVTSPTPLPSASSSPIPYQTPANPPENPLVTARVSQEFNAWQHGHINRSTYSPTAGGTYIDALIAVVSPELKAIGPQQNIRYRTTALLLGDFVYRYDITGESGVVSVLYSMDQNGKTDSIVFTPQIFRAAFIAP